MFGSIVRLAQAEVENSIGQAVDKVIVTAPFVVAVGFAAAAASIELADLYGAVSGLLLMSAAFVILGTIVAAVISYRRSKQAAASSKASSASSNATSDERPGSEAPVNSPEALAADHELLLSALKTAAPFALPQLLRLIFRNLPVLAAFAAALFVLTRPTSSEEDASSAFAEGDGVVPGE